LAGDDRASLIAQRLRAQLLTGPPARNPAAVAGQLLAVQAQDPRAVRLAVRARTRGVTAADFDRALSDERSVVISWLNRGTLHLVRSEDFCWLQSLTTPQLQASSRRRLHQEGVTPEQAEKAARMIERALAEDGPQTRSELRNRLASAGIPTAGQALVHLLLFATIKGLTVRGPMLGAEHAFVLARDWIGPPKPVVREQALAQLARRYLTAHAPAGERDLAWWAGLPLRDARRGLREIERELVQREDGLLELKGSPPGASLGGVRLLGAFEPLLLGWRSRDEILGRHAPKIIQGGMFRSMILADGRVAGTWQWRGGEVELERFRSLTRPEREALEGEREAVRRYLG
jgi:Winged helix DNA-binding domain